MDPLKARCLEAPDLSEMAGKFTFTEQVPTFKSYFEPNQNDKIISLKSFWRHSIPPKLLKIAVHRRCKQADTDQTLDIHMIWGWGARLGSTNPTLDLLKALKCFME